MEKRLILKLGVDGTGYVADSLFVAKKSGQEIRDGFILTSQFCKKCLDEEFSKEYQEEILNLVEDFEKKEKLIFGCEKNPLFISIKTDYCFDVGGLAEVFNIGLNDNIIEKSGEDLRKEYLEFIKFYAVKVCGHSEKEYRYKEEDSYLIKIEEFKEKFFKLENRHFPQDAKKQLIDIVNALLNYFNSNRMIALRKLYNISGDDFISLIIQSQTEAIKVRGSLSSRDKQSAINKVDGIINHSEKQTHISENYDFEQIAKFNKIASVCEKKFKNAVKINFSLINNKFFVEKIEKEKLSLRAQLKMIAFLLKEKILSKEEAIERTNASMINAYLHNSLDEREKQNAEKLAGGLPVSFGGGSGKICLTTQKAKEVIGRGESAILVCDDISPRDIENMKNLQGVVSINGGVTSHASVLARTMGIACIVSCKDVRIEGEKVYFSNRELMEGDYISLDGESGLVYNGDIKVCKAGEDDEELLYLLKVASSLSKMKVKANADNFIDAQKALNFGAEGIGLCRTEHMFFNKNRINVVRQMILASNVQERQKAIFQMQNMQKEDFIKIFEVAGLSPVTIRFLDPPLHEFLPKNEEDIKEFSKLNNIDEEEVKNKISSMREFNPMMGHRGSRLLVSYPEIALMQTQAVIEACIVVMSKTKTKVVPQIMIPLIGDDKEFKFVKNLVCQKADEIIKNNNVDLEYKVGAMLEVPRACLIADKIAKESDFFSFGTNDLTQMVYGVSRDDGDKFLKYYIEKGIFKFNPFKSLDRDGVGEFMKIACEKAREVKSNLQFGVCGEQGGDGKSIDFFYENKIDYVSCSPYTVPMAIISCAKVAIKERLTK